MTGKGSSGHFAALPTARPAGHPEQRTTPWPSSVGRCVGFSCSDGEAARQPTARQPTVRVKRRNPQDSLLRRSLTVHSSRTVGCSLVDLARSSIRPINASGHIRIALVDLVRLRQARHRSESSSTHDSGDEEQWLAGFVVKWPVHGQRWGTRQGTLEPPSHQTTSLA